MGDDEHLATRRGITRVPDDIADDVAAGPCTMQTTAIDGSCPHPWRQSIEIVECLLNESDARLDDQDLAAPSREPVCVPRSGMCLAAPSRRIAIKNRGHLKSSDEKTRKAWRLLAGSHGVHVRQARV